ncbi:unnamed protein product [Lepeophtheirus salmonis]|uniref:(salmon louse) hypothetical protein n=1 Tax=Lepeophtheirus salmonis TaxID=72036 RepID=A0A7R8CSE7_LEPSM|nr:unnamed protein product [Lepeophtheirus salmonis]CAF2864291.1 unnamed protein product [Lepeophtheirus salmonis]
MSTKEVLTLQCGPYSNFVGAHFWNIQDKDLLYEPRAVLPKTNPGVLYREVTFTPRLVSVDLKGGLGSLPRYGELYSVKDDRENTGLWDGEITKENSNEYEEKDIDESEKIRKSSL